VNTIEELLERESSGSGLKIREYAVGIRQADHVAALYPQKLALSSQTSGGRSVGIVDLRTKTTELFSSIKLTMIRQILLQALMARETDRQTDRQCLEAPNGVCSSFNVLKNGFPEGHISII
jgi:hypothetical protein